MKKKRVGRPIIRRKQFRLADNSSSEKLLTKRLMPS